MKILEEKQLLIECTNAINEFNLDPELFPVTDRFQKEEYLKQLFGEHIFTNWVKNEERISQSTEALSFYAFHLF